MGNGVGVGSSDPLYSPDPSDSFLAFLFLSYPRNWNGGDFLSRSEGPGASPAAYGNRLLGSRARFSFCSPACGSTSRHG